MKVSRQDGSKRIVLSLAFVFAVLLGAASSYAGVRLVGGAVADQPGVARAEPAEGDDGLSSRPLRGPIPDDLPVIGADDRAPAGMPRYIPALDRDGEHAGYVHYDTMIRLEGSVADEALPVYDDSLERVVGHMVPGYGFVPEGASASDLDPFDVEVRVGE